MKSRRYVAKFKIHEPTGVLQVYLDNGHTNTLENEPNHILVRGEITDKRKTRKHGIWDYADEKKSLHGYRQIYFTCPWCGAIGKSTIVVGMTQHADSVHCGYYGSGGDRTFGCRRHLTLSYREPGKEEEGHIAY